MQAAIGYLGVSTREQGHSGLGLAAQRFEIEAFDRVHIEWALSHAGKYGKPISFLAAAKN